MGPFLFLARLGGEPRHRCSCGSGACRPLGDAALLTGQLNLPQPLEHFTDAGQAALFPRHPLRIELAVAVGDEYAEPLLPCLPEGVTTEIGALRTPAHVRGDNHLRRKILNAERGSLGKHDQRLSFPLGQLGRTRREVFNKPLAARAAELAEREAQALVVFAEAAALRVENLPAQVVVAADMSGRSQRAYLGDDAFGQAGQERLGVFVADRYGELYAQWVAREEGGLPGVGEVLEWLGQIQLACEECGVSEWPAGS